jgi:hypothetical protein
MVSHTTTVKTTINVEEERLTRIKRTAQNLYGDTRSLSELMGDAAESFDAESILEAFTKKMGWEAMEYPSLREIEERRPTSTEDSAETIREMREGRADRIS